MPRIRPELGRLVVAPFATIGIISTVLLWTVEHAGVAVAVLVAVAALGVAIWVVRQARLRIDSLALGHEALLQTADEQSRKADAANRAKDQFLATLSHELRTPLNSIIGWSRLIITGRLDSQQTNRAVHAIERAGWAQTQLIENLLDMSRIVDGKLHIATRAALPQPVVEDAVRLLKPAAEAKQITVDVQLDSTLGALEIDPDRLRQVVWNLVSNAIKFTPTAGRVSVELRAAGDAFEVLVTDTGIGFSPGVAEHLFERFRQVDNSATRPYGGLGLGLGIVRHLVEQHGGTVKATSAGPERGSTFCVRIPNRAALILPSANLENDRTPLLQGIKVLVVDDDSSAQQITRSGLEHYGASVVTASSAKEARDRLVEERPNVLLSDLVMPDQDGLQLIRDIRSLDERRGGRTPAAALSVLGRAEDRDRALSAGYQTLVTKPADPVKLAAVVERLAHGVTPANRHSGSP